MMMMTTMMESRWKGNGLLLPPQLERIVTAIVKKKEQYNAIEHQTSLPKHAKFTATATKKKVDKSNIHDAMPSKNNRCWILRSIVVMQCAFVPSSYPKARTSTVFENYSKCLIFV